MTSANVVEYTIKDLKGNEVGKHSQHCLCKTKWGRLLKFTPAENFTITPWGYDEDEAYWEGKTISLKKFIDDLIKNKSRFNEEI